VRPPAAVERGVPSIYLRRMEEKGVIKITK
jgi:hypothetical protein